MITVADSTPLPVDSSESRSYNRVKRWLGIADFGWACCADPAAGNRLERHATRSGLAWGFIELSFAVFLYVLMLMVISRALGFPLDFYGFRSSIGITSRIKN